MRRLIWSALALDGYIQEVLPTFYKIGEWFIGCIILLYLVFPLLRIALLKKPALLAAALVFFHVGWVLFYPGVVQIEHSAASRLLEFAAGMYLARYWKRLPRWAPFAGCAAALLVLLVPLPGPRMFWLPLLGAGMFLILMWAGEFITACWARIALQKIAQLSYPLYLVHHVTLTILFVPRLNGHILGLGGVWAIYFLYLATAALAAAALQVVAKAVQKAGWVLAGKKEAVRR